MSLKKHIWIIYLLIMVSACHTDKSESDYQPAFSKKPFITQQEYIFGVHPLHNPKQLQAIYGPLVDYLSQHIKHVNFRLEASRNYATYDEKIYANKFHFTLPNPYQTIIAAEHGYRIFAKMGDDENFRGLIVTRKDSPLKTLDDLKGKKVSYPAPTALAATMMPQYFLHKNGINVIDDIETVYVGSQESSLMTTYLNKVAAGAVWPLSWKNFVTEHAEMANQLEIKWQTAPLPNNGVVVRDDIPEKLVKQVKNLLLSLHTHEAGREILARMPLSKFESANYESYQPVRDFVTVFTQEIRDPRAE